MVPVYCPLPDLPILKMTYYLFVSTHGATRRAAAVMKQVGQREQTLLPEARMKAPMEAARPTHTVETSDLTYRMVSNTAMPVALSASKSQACQCKKL